MATTVATPATAVSKSTCMGLTKNGKGPRCSNMVTAPETHCHVHKGLKPAAPKAPPVPVNCHGQKKDGTPCGNKIKAPEQFCHLHKGGASSPPKAAPAELIVCQGQKKDGTQCGNKIKSPETHCHL